MTDRLQQLLDHTADRLAAGVQAPPLAAPPARQRRSPAWALPLAAAAAAVLVGGGVVLTAQLAVDDSPRSARGTGAASPAASPERTFAPTRTEYAGEAPELGTSLVPVDVVGRSVLTREETGEAPVRADLLARLVDGRGEHVLVAHIYRDGRTCFADGYLPPAENLSFSKGCSAPGGPAPFAADDIAVSGAGPGSDGAPAVVYGSAVPGARTIEVEAPGRDTVRVPARDGGARYGHRSYFIAPFELGENSATIRAYDESGKLLAVIYRR